LRENSRPWARAGFESGVERRVAAGLGAAESNRQGEIELQANPLWVWTSVVVDAPRKGTTHFAGPALSKRIERPSITSLDGFARQEEESTASVGKIGRSLSTGVVTGRGPSTPLGEARGVGGTTERQARLGGVWSRVEFGLGDSDLRRRENDGNQSPDFGSSTTSPRKSKEWTAAS